MNRRILLVDDEQDVLDSFKRQLRKEFQIETALSSIEGMKLIASGEPFAVIVSDYQMPGVNGIQFLKSAKQKAPDSVRVMLTGQADHDTAINAVNEGHIFRFLTKPCPVELFVKTLQAGIDLYQLISAEKELLEKTLSGSIGMIVEILGLVNPIAFGNALRIRKYVKIMVDHLELPNAWQFELAGMLSMIGCVTVDPDILKNMQTGAALEDFEYQLYQKHPQIGSNLLHKIPRLENGAKMIGTQTRSRPKSDWWYYKQRIQESQITVDDLVAIGGNLIRIAIDFDKLIMRGKSVKSAFEDMLGQPFQYLPEATIALKASLKKDEMVGGKPSTTKSIVRSKKIQVSGKKPVTDSISSEFAKKVYVNQLKTDMIIDQDVLTVNGILLAVRGQNVTNIMIQRFQAFAKSVGIMEPFGIIER